MSPASTGKESSNPKRSETGVRIGSPALAGESRIVVTQVRSEIGSKPKHKGALRALGLGRIGQARDLPDRPEIRGVISGVAHLVAVQDPKEHANMVAQGKRLSGEKYSSAKQNRPSGYPGGK